jgi:putative FmdB family regulatory protein
MAIYSYRCKRCGVEFDDEHSIKDHPREVTCICGGPSYQLIKAVTAIVPYEFKAIKPYTPEVGDVKRETEEVCRKRGWNPKDFLDDSFYDGTRE